MRWYGTLVEGPTGAFTVMMTDFERAISGGLVTDDRPELISSFLTFLEERLAEGDRIRLVIDRLGVRFRPSDPPTLWRTLVEKYSHGTYTARSDDERSAYYVLDSANGTSPFDAPMCVALVVPNAVDAVCRYLAGEEGFADAAECARVGCRVATDVGLMVALRANTHVPSSADLFNTLTWGDGDEFAGYTGGPDLWATERDAASLRNPDIAEFHLHYAEAWSRYRDLGDQVAQVLAVMLTCERYRMRLRVAGPGSSPAMATVPLPLELLDVPDPLVRAWSS